MHEDWSTISIRKEYLRQIEQLAKKNHRSVAGELELILIESGEIVEKEPLEVPAQ